VLISKRGIGFELRHVADREQPGELLKLSRYSRAIWELAQFDEVERSAVEVVADLQKSWRAE